MEKTIGTRYIYRGKILGLRIDSIKTPGGRLSEREIVEHPGAAAIVPILEDGRIILVKQYRKAVESFLLEIPAGKIEAGESPEECAARELKEETGFSAGKFTDLLEFYPSPGYSSEIIKIFKAENLKPIRRLESTHEITDISSVRLDEIMQNIKKGEIKDGKTIAGVFAVALLI
jgi:ADP-ribose pyrophosphatase